MAVTKHWYLTRLTLLMLIASAALLMFMVSSSLAPCSRVFAQSTSCSVGDTETFTGPTSFSDEINVGATPGPGAAGQVMVSAGASAPPEWASLAQTVLKTADETDASAPVQSDDELLFAVAANKVYSVQVGLRTLYNSGTTFGVAWSVPSGTIYDCLAVWYDGPGASAENSPFDESSGTEVLQGGAGFITIDCTLDTAGTAGDVTLQWYGGGSVTVQAGSWIHYSALN